MIIQLKMLASVTNCLIKIRGTYFKASVGNAKNLLKVIQNVTVNQSAEFFLSLSL